MEERIRQGIERLLFECQDADTVREILNAALSGTGNYVELKGTRVLVRDEEDDSVIDEYEIHVNVTKN